MTTFTFGQFNASYLNFVKKKKTHKRLNGCIYVF